MTGRGGGAATVEPLQLRTHTSLWRVERRLYKVYDFTMPVPVSVRQLGVVVAVGVPWLLLLRILRVPFTPPFGELAWLAPPVLAAWWANRPVAEGKRLGELLVSQLRYLAQPRTLTGLRPAPPARAQRVWAAVWAPRDPGGGAGAPRPADHPRRPVLPR